MRAVLYLSPLRKLCSKIAPVMTLRSLALMTAPARASLMCSTLTMERICPSISNIVPLRKSFVLIKVSQELHCQQVAFETEPGDDAASPARRHAAGTELLPRVDVRDVDLDHRQAQRLQTVQQCDRVVGQSAGIENDPRRS